MRRFFKLTKRMATLLLMLLVIFSMIGFWNNQKVLPYGVSYQGELHPAHDVAYFVDQSWLDEQGIRHLEQEIFDEVISMISNAETFVLIDMFLFNDFQGPNPETQRKLSEDVTSALVQRKQERPDIEIIVITDPINEVYGGLQSVYFEKLKAQGIRVVITNLNVLRDSNPTYSAFWRLFIKPFGRSPADTLPNPLGSGKVSLRSYLELLNFKANHRKLVVADDAAGEFSALVTSGNPHDGSSAHRNAALRFSGKSVIDIITAESALLAFSDEEPMRIDLSAVQATGALQTDLSTQYLTEKKIKDAVILVLDGANKNDHVDLMMFYFSEREIVEALKRAQQRGVTIRIILDPNKDAFGRQKNGIPNRLVAEELHLQGIDIRWCATAGEQCHAKNFMVSTDESCLAMLGSANFTRRNLNDFNLEADVLLSGHCGHSVFGSIYQDFNEVWENQHARIYSWDYERYQDASKLKYGLYRFMEFTGLSTF